VTAPGPLAPLRPAPPAHAAGPGATVGVVSLPIAPTNDDGADLPWHGTGLVVRAWTSYVVTVTGSVTVSSNPAVACYAQYLTYAPKPPYGSEGSYGPDGTGWYYELQVATDGLRHGVGGAAGPTTLTSDTLFAWGDHEIGVMRKGIQGSIGGGAPCALAGFYLLASDQTLTVTALDGQGLHLDPGGVSVRRGTTVRFTARGDDGHVIDTPNWQFVPLPGDTTTTTTTTCGIMGANPCDVTVRGNGTLLASKGLDGYMRSDRARVRVYSTFALRADSASVARGSTVTFTPWLDGAPGPAAEWRWRRADGTTVPAPCAVMVDALCRYAPDTTGTMWAYTTDGDSASAHVSVNPPKLVCPGSLARGNTASCTITNAGAQVVIKQWRFVDSAATATVIDASQTDTWSGPMVTSGTVYVTAEIGGAAFADSAFISITSRGWGPITTQVTNVGQAGLTYLPTKVSDLADSHVAVPLEYPSVPMIPFQRITTGPNQGWAYLTQHVNPVTIAVRWNQAWNPADPWYQLQTGGTDPSGQPYCGPSDMPLIEQRAQGHEGLVQGVNNSHASVYRDYFASFANPSDTTPQARLERLIWRQTSYAGQSDTSFIQYAFQDIVVNPANSDPRQNHYNPVTQSGGPTADVPLAIFPCYLRF
jgi:hypothetical protein